MHAMILLLLHLDQLVVDVQLIGQPPLPIPLPLKGNFCHLILYLPSLPLRQVLSKIHFKMKL